MLPTVSPLTVITLYVTVQELGRYRSLVPRDFVLVDRNGSLHEPLRGVTLDGSTDILQDMTAPGALIQFRVPEATLPGHVELRIPVTADFHRPPITS